MRAKNGFTNHTNYFCMELFLCGCIGDIENLFPRNFHVDR